MNNDLISYHEMIKQIANFEIWLQAHSIKPKRNRLVEMKAFLQQLDESWRDGPNQMADLKKKLGIEYMIFGLNEANSLIDIFKFLSTYQPHNLPKKTIKDILDGPFLSKDEILGDGNVNPRNYQFELDVAARLGNAGICVTKFDDVQFVFEDKAFSIQCKRLISDGRITANITKAYEQLRRQFSGENNRGIIALSMDKLIGADKNLLVVNTIEEAESKLIAHGNYFWKEHADSFDGLFGSDVLAVFIIFRIVVELNNRTRLNCFSQLYGINMCERKSENRDLMNRLFYQIS